MSRIGPEWIDSGLLNTDFVLTSDGNGNAEWTKGDNLTGARNLPLTATFFDRAKPYLEKNTTTYTTIGDFIYDGSLEFIPNLIKVIGSASCDVATHECRLYDIYNLVEIVAVSWTLSAKGIYKAIIPPLNLPTAEAIFEIQVRKTGAAKTRIHYVAME